MSSAAGSLPVDEIERRIAPLLAPLVPPPCGVDARFDPAHEDVRSEVAKLESPGAPPVQWRRVALRGGELLASTSKDLLIASYMAHAYYEDEGVVGLALGLRLINELMDRYWDALFPPPARLRARASALAWWIDKTGARLDSQLDERARPDDALLALLEAETARLAANVRARLGDMAPAVGPLQRAIERLKLAAPADGAATVAATATVASPPVVPAEVVAAAGGGSHAPETAGASGTASPTAATADAIADVDEALEARAAEWLAPIRADAPAGEDARYDDGYGRIRDAIKRLDMPSADAVDWQEILRESSAVLRTRSKDLLIAAHLAHALFETRKLDGAITGLCLLRGLLGSFWESLYPDQKRGTRARGSALGWWLPRLERLADYPLVKEELPLVPLLERAVKRLDEQADALGEHKPAFGPLYAALTRLGFAAQALSQAAAAPALAPVVAGAQSPAAPAPPAAPAVSATAATPKSIAVAVPQDAGPSPSVANKAELNLFFTRLRGQLWDIAGALRAASDRDPLAYRLSRVASYLTLVEPLQHKDNVTPLPAPSPLIASEVAALAGKQHWDKVLGTAEGSLRKSPYLLDLHRHVHTALGHLGEAYRPAQASVEAELQSLLRRLPELPQLKFQDGSAFADDATRGFLAGLTRSGERGGSTRDDAEGLPLEQLEAAQGLVAAGRTEQALDAFHAVLGRIEQGRDRFRARLAMARACESAGSDAMAVALFEGLVADLDRHGLDEWEPSLASECLAGYHQCLRNLAPRDKEMAQAAAVVYRRLCRVDPKRALSESLRR